jgi:O-antigen/teichoic acid export membrane protein
MTPTLNLRRSRAMMLTGVVTVAARFAGLFSSIYILPTSLNHLGADRYAELALVLALTSSLTFLDFGIGNGLLNSLPKALAENDSVKCRRLIGGAAGFLSVVSTAILAVTSLIWIWLNFIQHNVAALADAPGSLVDTLLVFVVVVALSIPVSLVQKVQLAVQAGWIAGGFAFLGSLVSVIAVNACARFDVSTPLFLLGVVAPPLLLQIVNGAVYFTVIRRDLLPSLSTFSINAAREALLGGNLFFALQVTVALAYASDSWLIAWRLSADELVSFTIVDRYFSVVGLVVGTFSTALWPAFSDAVSRQQWQWLHRTLWRSMLLSALATGLLVCTLLLVCTTVVPLWLHRSWQANWWLLVGMALWKLCEAIGSPLAACLNALAIVRLQMWSAALTAMAALALKVWFLPVFGAMASPWCTSGVWLLVGLVPLSLAVRRELSRRLEIAHVD